MWKIRNSWNSHKHNLCEAITSTERGVHFPWIPFKDVSNSFSKSNFGSKIIKQTHKKLPFFLGIYNGIIPAGCIEPCAATQIQFFLTEFHSGVSVFSFLGLFVLNFEYLFGIKIEFLFDHIMEESRLCQWSVIRSILAIVQWWGFNVTVIIMNKWIFQVCDEFRCVVWFLEVFLLWC